MTSEDEIESETNLNLNIGEVECPVCLQTAVHPTKLPCGHVFCYLCLKGVVIISHRCALCRRETSKESIDNPQLIYGVNSVRNTKPFEDGYQWFYEGRNGWWQYDERTSIEIENAFKSNNKTCTIFVAGFIYIVDFETMMQRRQNDPGKKRCVKRDLAIVPKKGVAGIRLDENLSTPDRNPNTIALVNQAANTTATTATPPQTPQSPSPPPPPPPPTRSSPSTSNSILQYLPSFSFNSFMDLARRNTNYNQNINQQQPSGSGLNNYRNNIDLSISPTTINLSSSTEHDEENEEYVYDDEDDDNNDVILSRTIGDMQRLSLQPLVTNSLNDDDSDSDHV